MIVMVVDDNEDDVLLVRHAFAKAKLEVEVVAFSDGESALEYFFQAGASPKLPRVILLDLHLPGVDGLSVLRQLRACEWTRLIPIVLFTTCGEAGEATESYLSGANSYVRKPVHPGEVGDVLAQVGSYWTSVNHVPET